MTAFGIGWGRAKPPRILVAALACSLLLAPALAPVAAYRGPLLDVIVRGAPGALRQVEDSIEAVGGDVGRRIGIIDGVAASVPRDAVARLSSSPHVRSITRDRRVRLMHAVDGFDGSVEPGSSYNLGKSIKAHDAWKDGITGSGVDIAMIDSGVVPVNGLTAPAKVVNGPDLSVESQSDNLRYLDTYGHGTHMAGIMAGKDDGLASVQETTHHDTFAGIAPESRVVNIKVAGHSGATDVSQVIAAIDWVVQHRNDNGLNIRVLNLSFGTDGTQDYRIDPLTYAAEVAWHHGIVVVVAAGNQQFGTESLNNPAYDPYVIAVGADDTKGSYDVADDEIPAWSARGDGVRNPDLVAPGRSLVSLRAKGSMIDTLYPEGRVNDRFFKGTGTSQAAAVVSGAAALLLQQRPSLTPDQVKKILTSSATPLPAADPVAQGSGLVNVRNATTTPTPTYVQTWDRATGSGSLEAARGTPHLWTNDGDEVRGEYDIMGAPWEASSWSASSWSASSWSGGTWNGNEWTGACWCASSWSASSWSASSWSASSWSASSWSASSWSASSWSASSWSASSWSASSWSASSWSASSWSASSWSASSWSASSWSASSWS